MMQRRFALLAMGSILAACGGAASPAPNVAAPPASASGLKRPGDAAIGDRTTCPISKEEFTVTPASPKAEYAGKTYYFCCPGCDAKFKADPKKYLGGT